AAGTGPAAAPGRHCRWPGRTRGCCGQRAGSSRRWASGGGRVVEAKCSARLGCPDGLAMPLHELQRFPHRLHHGPRRDRGAGELVEVAAVATDPPASWWRLVERAAVEAADPAAAALLDAVAQARGFRMRGDANAEDPAFGIDADQQADVAG